MSKETEVTDSPMKPTQRDIHSDASFLRSVGVVPMVESFPVRGDAELVAVEPQEQHALILIGWTGVKRAYLDIPLAEAISRYTQAVGDVEGAPIEQMSFGDEFGVYDAWELHRLQ